MTPDQRREFLRAAQEAANAEQSRMTPEDRRAILQAAQESKVEDARRADEISRMIKEEIGRHGVTGDVMGKTTLSPAEFERAKIEPYQTRSKDVSEALERLKDPEEARRIYAETIAKEARNKPS